ncbi:MAG TPA: D-alanyl-D-alanine carboxypeptidase, partial [Marinilabiliaceae bacterium]|nr:D-alanyl-D-alanine carboxypeptidase [Marinilabiliaceae bacterium]
LGLNETVHNPANRWSAAALKTKMFWQSKNIVSPFLVYDGSGLSPRNKVSSRFMVEVLKYMNSSANSLVFQKSLAVGGVSGTLRNMWQEDRYKGRVVAKSGTMEGVLNYAGYLRTNSGRKVAFSVMINNYTGTSEYTKEYIVALISEWIDLL